jgi:cytochrome b561
MAQPAQFSILSRALHWTMAAMILVMLFIGVGMVASLTDYHWLVSIHKPLGALILVLAALRLVNRLLNPAPPLPEGMPALLRLAAHASHVALYALMFAVPLVGWGMLSAAHYPIVLYGSLELPPILPQDPALYATLRQAHTILAFLLFATFLAHLGAALMHALIFRDGVFPSMASWRTRSGAIAARRNGRAPSRSNA